MSWPDVAALRGLWALHAHEARRWPAWRFVGGRALGIVTFFGFLALIARVAGEAVERIERSIFAWRDCPGDLRRECADSARGIEAQAAAFHADLVARDLEVPDRAQPVALAFTPLVVFRIEVI